MSVVERGWPSWASNCPTVVAPLAAYVPAVRTGNLVYTAGQLPMVGGKLAATGKVGAEVSPEAGKELARMCALNALAAVDSLVGIDSVARVVKVVGFVASAPGFNGQPGVINGASELFGEVFGDAGRACPVGGRGFRAAAGRAGRGRAGRRGRVSDDREGAARSRDARAPRVRAAASGHRNRVGAAVRQPGPDDPRGHQHLGAARPRQRRDRGRRPRARRRRPHRTRIAELGKIPLVLDQPHARATTPAPSTNRRPPPGRWCVRWAADSCAASAGRWSTARSSTRRVCGSR